jgi:hypothetical protein
MRLRLEWSARYSDRHHVAVAQPCSRRTIELGRSRQLLVISSPTRVLYGDVVGGSVRARVLRITGAGNVGFVHGSAAGDTCAAPRATPESRAAPGSRSFGVINGSRAGVIVEWLPAGPPGVAARGRVPPCTRRRLFIQPGRYTLALSSPEGPVSFSWFVPSDDQEPLPIPAVGVLRDGRISLDVVPRERLGCVSAESP